MQERVFEPILSTKAWESLRSLSKRRQEKLTRLIYQLANDPFRLGEYQTRDHTGRVLENLRLGDHIITYWADDPVKELRILDIHEL
jgi:mRNA-degrading endonuclease RelE of RelBE toxin-antitoxin system